MIDPESIPATTGGRHKLPRAYRAAEAADWLENLHKVNELKFGDHVRIYRTKNRLRLLSPDELREYTSAGPEAIAELTDKLEEKAPASATERIGALSVRRLLIPARKRHVDTPILLLTQADPILIAERQSIRRTVAETTGINLKPYDANSFAVMLGSIPAESSVTKLEATVAFHDIIPETIPLDRQTITLRD